MDDSLLLELLPDYALNLLTDEERAEVTALLARSESARAQLLAYEQTLDALTLFVPERKAPDHLTADFAKRLQVEITAIPAHTPAPRIALRARLTMRSVLLAAATLILILGGSIVFGIESQQRNDQRNATEALITSITHDQTALKTALTFTDPTVTAHVTFYSRSGSADAVIAMQNMPPLPTDKQYQFWLITDSSTVSAGVFSPDSTNSQQLVHLSSSENIFGQIAITVEPAGGSPQPTSKPIATGKLSTDL